MKAISIRQPWAWLIVNGYKDVENRTWPTSERGTVLIHAAKTMTTQEYVDALNFIRSKQSIADLADKMPKPSELEFGGIVGVATIRDCVQSHTSPWFTGPYGFTLRDAYSVPFAPFKGALGFFEAGVVTGIVNRDDRTTDLFGETP